MEEMGLDQDTEDMEILDKVDIDKHRTLIDNRLEEMLDDDFIEENTNRRCLDINFRIT